MGEKEPGKRIRATSLSVMLIIVVGIALIYMMNVLEKEPEGSRILSTGLVLDYVRRDVTGLKTFKWFFRRTGGKENRGTRGGSGSVVGDGVLPEALRNLSPEELERELDKARGMGPFDARKPTELEELAWDAQQRTSDRCNMPKGPIVVPWWRK